MCLALSPSPLFSQEKGTEVLLLPPVVPVLSLHPGPPDSSSEEEQNYGSRLCTVNFSLNLRT